MNMGFAQDAHHATPGARCAVSQRIGQRRPALSEPALQAYLRELEACCTMRRQLPAPPHPPGRRARRQAHTAHCLWPSLMLLHASSHGAYWRGCAVPLHYAACAAPPWVAAPSARAPPLRPLCKPKMMMTVDDGSACACGAWPKDASAGGQAWLWPPQRAGRSRRRTAAAAPRPAATASRPPLT